MNISLVLQSQWLTDTFGTTPYMLSIDMTHAYIANIRRDGDKPLSKPMMA